MFDRIDGQDAKRDRNAKLQRYLRQAFGAFTGHIFKVWCAATNDRAQRDDGVVLALGRYFLRDQRNFEGTRCADDSQVVFVDAMTNEGINSTLNKAFNNETVKTAHHKRITAFGGDEVTFDGLQGHETDSRKRAGALKSAPRGSFTGQVFYNFQVEAGYCIEPNRRTE